MSKLTNYQAQRESLQKQLAILDNLERKEPEFREFLASLNRDEKGLLYELLDSELYGNED